MADLYLGREIPCSKVNRATPLALLRHVREGIRVSCRAVILRVVCIPQDIS